MKSKLSLFAMAMALTLSGCEYGAGEGIFVPADSKGARAGNEVLLFSVTSDAKPGKRYQALLQVAGDMSVQKLIYRENDGDLVYELDTLKTATGLVLLEQDGYKVVRLKSNDFDPKGGGAIRMIYLKNALSGSEGTFNIDIVLEGQNWITYANDSEGRRPFQNMVLKKHTIFGKTVGMSSVRVSDCPGGLGLNMKGDSGNGVPFFILRSRISPRRVRPAYPCGTDYPSRGSRCPRSGPRRCCPARPTRGCRRRRFQSPSCGRSTS